MKATVFLGGGRITSALVAGLRRANYRAPIIVHDRNRAKLGQLAREHAIRPEPNLHRAVASAGMLLIAVRPDSVRDLLAAIGAIDRPLLVVSLAAGIPLSMLRRHLGPNVRWVRAMPSPVCRNGRGLTAVTFPASAPPPVRRQVQRFFSKMGRVLEIPEAKFDAFTVTYSSSHGYHALAMLARAAQRVGLDRKSALAAAAHALADGVLAWREGGMSLESLLREAATPGGIAATVMNAIDEAGYAKTMERALRRGMARARANAKK
ncbi:MAG TPA: pyrroline-5-carboxylate reductase dimerization domain-containing protein [Terriglobales bacterium]